MEAAKQRKEESYRAGGMEGGKGDAPRIACILNGLHAMRNPRSRASPGNAPAHEVRDMLARECRLTARGVLMHAAIIPSGSVMSAGS